MNTAAATERHLEARQSRRMHAEDRFLGRVESREAAQASAAEQLVGELCRDGSPVFYINELTKRGAFTGKTREFGSFASATFFLTRNKYV